MFPPVSCVLFMVFLVLLCSLHGLSVSTEFSSDYPSVCWVLAMFSLVFLGSLHVLMFQLGFLHFPNGSAGFSPGSQASKTCICGKMETALCVPNKVATAPGCHTASIL